MPHPSYSKISSTSSVCSSICSSGRSHSPGAGVCGAIAMSTLPSLILRSPRSPVFRPIAGHEPSSSCTEVNLPISFKRASGRAWSGLGSGSRLGCCGAEHGKAFDGLEHEHGAAARRFSPQSGARKGRAQKWRCKAHLDSVEVGVVEEANGAAVHRNHREERLLPKQQSGEPREIQLKSVRGTDFAGAPISSQLWEWRHRWNIHYFGSAGANLIHSESTNLQMFWQISDEFRVWKTPTLPHCSCCRGWAIDFLGQGKSWPSHDPAPAEEVMEEVLEGQANAKILDWGLGKTPEPWAQDLVYSVDAWRDQVHAFIEKVISEPVDIVGNSLGGYVGTYFAATNPELVKGMALLNATPFWAFMPNVKRWDLLRNPVTVQKMIELVYADRSVINDKLIRQMLEATHHPAAFASIVFAPRAHTDFGQYLISLKETRTPMCMIYGKEDPCVVPFWGQRAKQRNPDAVYYELSPAGHCPHHEAPEVVNTLVRKWVESVQSQGALSPSLLEVKNNFTGL